MIERIVTFGILFLFSNCVFAQSFVLKFQDIAYLPKGNYHPKHCLAVWVNNANGTTEKYSRTLCVLANNYKQHLNKYQSFNPSFNKAGTSTADGTSGASATTYPNSPRTVNWNLVDAFGVKIPDGKYKIYFEQTTINGSGPYTSVEFIKAADKIDLKPAATTGFQNVQIIYTPATSSAEYIDEIASFSLYPNPATNTLNLKVFLAQNEVSTIHLYSSNGNVLFSTKHLLNAGENSIVLSLNEMNLPKGILFVKVTSSKFQVIESFVKK